MCPRLVIYGCDIDVQRASSQINSTYLCTWNNLYIEREAHYSWFKPHDMCSNAINSSRTTYMPEQGPIAMCINRNDEHKENILTTQLPLCCCCCCCWFYRDPLSDGKDASPRLANCNQRHFLELPFWSVVRSGARIWSEERVTKIMLLLSYNECSSQKTIT